VKIGREVRQGCCLSPVVFYLYSKYLTNKAVQGLGDFRIGGKVILSVKCEDFMLLAKEKTMCY
jgi:hypothetical protein